MKIGDIVRPGPGMATVGLFAEKSDKSRLVESVRRGETIVVKGRHGILSAWDYGKSSKTGRSGYFVESKTELVPAIEMYPDDTPHLPRSIGNLARYVKYGATESAVTSKLKLITLFGHKVRVHSKIADRLAAWEHDVRDYEKATSKKPWSPKVVECMCWRSIRGSSTRSMHSWAIAVDFDPDTNERGSHKTNIPGYVRTYARHNGMYAGYDFTSIPDPMHFEYRG